MGFGKKRSNKVGVGAITTNKKKLFAEGGMMDDGKDVDPVSGNDVPVGSLAEEVRDDVDAKLSPGEFVFPADVVRFIGLNRLMQMRDQAKKGLMRMNDIGQMGNAEEAGEKADDTYEEGEEDDDFENNIDEVMKEVDREEDIGRQTEMAFNIGGVVNSFNTGGFVNPTYYDLTKAPKNPALDIRYFKDNEGKDFYMPFINGKPMKPMPNGATQTGAPAPKTTGGGGGGGDAGGADVAGVIAGTRDLTSTSALTNTVGTITGSTATPKTVGETWGTQDVYGTYTGNNLADFGRTDMIYNPGGSGAAGEVVTEDLWNTSITNANVKLGTTVLSALASAMGVPGIVTLPIRLAINKYGADAVNAYLGRLNQEMVGKAGGIDTSKPEGVAAAASQIDQLTDRDAIKGQVTVRGETRQYEYNPQPAASSGAIGTGGIAANASKAVSDALIGTGLSDTEIGNLSQRAADAVVRGIDINTAVNNAKTAAVDAIQSTEAGSYMSKEEIADAVFGRQPSDIGDLEGTMGGGLGDADEFTTDFYETDELNVGDFWGTMEEEEETEDSRFFSSQPTRVRDSVFKKKTTQQG